jgi:hypothetical protein
MKRRVHPASQSWRPPTRRAFMAMLVAAAGGVAVRSKVANVALDRPRNPWNGKTRWIGHC